MKKKIYLFILGCLLGTTFIQLDAQSVDGLYRFRSNGNPIITHKFTCDPATLVVGDTLWLFTGHDFKGGQDGYNLKDWCVFSTTDLVNWTEYPLKLLILHGIKPEQLMLHMLLNVAVNITGILVLTARE